MKETYTTLYIDATDELTIIIEKVKKAKHNDVVLAIPQGASILQSLINLKLIKTNADMQEKVVTIATTDHIGGELAQKAGITVQKSATEKPTPPPTIPTTPSTTATGLGGIRVHQYNRKQTPPAPSKRILTINEPLKLVSMEEETEPELEPLEEETTQKAAQEQIQKTEHEPNLVLPDTIPVTPTEKVIPDNTSTTSSAKEDKKSPQLPIKKEEAPRLDQSSRIKINDILGGSEQQGKTERLNKKLRKSQAKKQTSFKTSSLNIATALKWTLTTITGLTIIGAIVFATIILPRAEISITPAQVTLTGESEIQASANPQSPQEIEAQEIAIEKTLEETFQATGEKETKQTATVTLAITNTFDSAPQPIVAGTRFESTDGKIFRTTEPVTIPGFTRVGGQDTPGSITITAKADEEGPTYNNEKGVFKIPGFKSGPKYDAITATAAQPSSGGSNLKTPTITPQDIDQAEETLQQRILEEIKTELQATSEGYILSDKGTKGEKFYVTSQASGANTKEFTATLTIKQTALVYKQEHLEALVQEQYSNGLTENQEIIPNSLSINITEHSYNLEKGTITIATETRATIQSTIDEAKLKESLKKKSQTEIKKQLDNQEEIQEYSIKLWPFWVRSAPNDSKRIIITTKEK